MRSNPSLNYRTSYGGLINSNVTPPRSRPLHRQPGHGIHRLFLGALGQEGGQLFGVVRGVDGVAIDVHG